MLQFLLSFAMASGCEQGLVFSTCLIWYQVRHQNILPGVVPYVFPENPGLTASILRALHLRFSWVIVFVWPSILLQSFLLHDGKMLLMHLPLHSGYRLFLCKAIHRNSAFEIQFVGVP